MSERGKAEQPRPVLQPGRPVLCDVKVRVLQRADSILEQDIVLRR
jgi:hypothetical protein